jgi:hypothetical protein
MTTQDEFSLYFAWSPNPNAMGALKRWDWKRDPLSILISYFYIKQWRVCKGEELFAPRHTVLDSGAFSAWNIGKEVDIAGLTVESGRPYWQESVALDVIGNPDKSLANALWMKKQGSPAYPVFHYGEPWDLLIEYKKHFPKVGLSCLFGEKKSMSLKWVEQCFSRGWPHRFHSFGWIKDSVLMAFPWHSADASSWALQPGAFGLWRAFGGRMPLRGPQDLTANIHSFYRLEKQVRNRWSPIWQKTSKLLPPLYGSLTSAKSATKPSRKST